MTTAAPSPPSPSLVPGRTCGDCTVCCEYFNIDQPDLKKPAGVMCSHATGTGCGIYPNWPGICRTFFCAWRQTAAMTDEMRPDRLGAIFWITGKPQPAVLFEAVYVAGAATNDPRALDKDEVRRIVEMFSKDGALPVFLTWGGQQHLLHPAPDLADAILNPRTTPHRHLVPAGRRWLEAYLPFARQFAAQHGRRLG